jgi:hypothetical protein
LRSQADLLERVVGTVWGESPMTIEAGEQQEVLPRGQVRIKGRRFDKTGDAVWQRPAR